MTQVRGDLRREQLRERRGLQPNPTAGTGSGPTDDRRTGHWGSLLPAWPGYVLPIPACQCHAAMHGRDATQHALLLRGTAVDAAGVADWRCYRGVPGFSTEVWRNWSQPVHAALQRHSDPELLLLHGAPDWRRHAGRRAAGVHAYWVRDVPAGQNRGFQPQRKQRRGGLGHRLRSLDVGQ